MEGTATPRPDLADGRPHDPADDPPDLQHALQDAARLSDVVARRTDDTFGAAGGTRTGFSDTVIVNEAYDDILLDHDDKVMLSGRYETVLREMDEARLRALVWSDRLVTVLVKADGLVDSATIAAVRRGVRKAGLRAQELHRAMEAFDPGDVHFRRWRAHTRAHRRYARRTAQLCARCAQRQADAARTSAV